ncbi:MAG: hypothetical protein ABJA64_02800 [Candidatus Saccharibacteria bacterium]
MKSVFLQPPEIVPINGQPLIFLAGPIQGGPVWQPEAARRIHDLDETIIVASPRKEYGVSEFIYEKQVNWERHYLREAGKSGVILFWLANQVEETPGRPYAQTTRYEIGEWMAKHQSQGSKLVIGIESGFSNERYIRHRQQEDYPNIPIFDNLPDTTKAATELL